MTLTIKELKAKWNKEVGSGVQIFVKDILQSKEIFALKRGLKSTSREKRKDEFLEEEKTKGQRKADIIIYISPEIIIPIEIEKYLNIEAGKIQILNYQLDLDKKYGILTDGFTWRFYINNKHREFNLNQILDEVEIFLEFWKEYTKPEFYYLLFFEPPEQLPLLKKDQLFVEQKLPVEQNRSMFFEDITKLIRSFKNKLQIEGYLNGLDKKGRGKKAVEITYAYIIQFILYKTLVDNDFGEFQEEFENKVNDIHKHLKEERYKDILGIIDGISAQISENIYRPFEKEQEFINQKLLQLYRNENILSDVAPWLDIFVFIKKYNFANLENEIFGYIYENYLKEIYEEEKKGQYFTDPAVVNFMLQQVGFTPEEIKKSYQDDKNSISLIDPACGSGTFLYSAVDKVIKAFGNNTEEISKQIAEIVNNNILGLDIEEFPIYLAEMNILMRLLPLIISEKYNNPVDKKIKVFLTKDSVAEFLNTGLRNTKYDIMTLKSKNNQFSMNFRELDFEHESYVREKTDLEEMKKSLEEELPQIPRRRFDYVIGNPPYVGYNECSKQKVLLFELMKKGKVKLNNIYGVNLHSIPNHHKKYSPKPNLYAFFIAVGIALLKDNCKLCYIIPQTILTAGDLDVIRYHLAKFTTIEKIITFGGKMFTGRGIKQNKPVATSSLIFVLSKKIPAILHQVEIINYKDSNDAIEETLQNILAGKKISKKKILQNKLFKNVANWNFIKQSKKILDFYEEYKRNTDDISIYYEHVLAEQKFKSRFYFDIGYNINEKKLQDKAISEGYQFPKLDENFYLINSIKGFWLNERNKGSKFQIKLLTTNQGYNLLDSPHKILWSYINPRRFHFSSLPLIWARNQICAIGSRNKQELFYLLAILNSPINQILLSTILKSEQEKDLLISLASVKQFVRIPKISKDNQFIKAEIIKQTEEILLLEEKKLSDYVDFSKVMIQKFNKISVEDNNLVLEKDNVKIKLSIKENTSLIEKILLEKYNEKSLKLEKQITSLSELKDLPIIDYEKQKKIKAYIDDLVFALYFKISLEAIGLDKAEAIKEKCSKNPFYKLINK